MFSIFNGAGYFLLHRKTKKGEMFWILGVAGYFLIYKKHQKRGYVLDFGDCGGGKRCPPARRRVVKKL